MRNFVRLAQNMPVADLNAQLARSPELWNAYSRRRDYVASPHAQADDIWLRYSDPRNLVDKASYLANSFGTVWYPSSAVLTCARPLVLSLMYAVGAWVLDRLLITRLAPGDYILPHADNEGEYVNSGDIGRFHIVLQGLPGSVFKCGEEQVTMLSGEAWWFNATLPHEVVNESADDRVHMLVDCRMWDKSTLRAADDARISRMLLDANDNTQEVLRRQMEETQRT